MASRSVARQSRDAGPALSKEQVVAAALSYIDVHGLESFSMRNLARELGVYPTTLYWHAGNRDALLGMAIGLALFEIDPPTEVEWDAWLGQFARRFRETLHRHPNLASIVGGQMVTRAVTEFDVIEVILAKLAEAGFEGDSLVNAYNVVLGAIVGFVTIELARLPADEEWAQEMRDAIAGADPELFPHLAANSPALSNRAFGLRWLSGTQAPLDDSFEVLLSAVIGGVRSMLPDDPSAARDPS